ncbi:pyrophosphate-energised proton pump [Artemisia annua]|uniref:Pyrophosphate-energised proton pump n=1 Tax=Artemisia annua TaxID=35608 RepID=A0A2U1PYZ2_ARTAN|nr:pyrophosphate-energised proton pump [Artemisia annua]
MEHMLGTTQSGVTTLGLISIDCARKVRQPESKREHHKNNHQGFAIGSAAPASFPLFSAYMDEEATFAYTSFTQVGKSSHFVSPGLGCAAVGIQGQPDFERCVVIVVCASLREMIKPTVLSPIFTGAFYIYL